MWRALSFLILMNLAAACAEPEEVVSAGAGEETVGAVVVCSDYVSSQVALLGEDGLTVVAGSLIHSGSEEPGLSLSLSGDVVLPGSPHESGLVLLLDRTHGVLTWVDTATAVVTRQLALAEAFPANPHDALLAADGSLFVTRYGSDPDGVHGGDDVAVFDAEGALVQTIQFTATAVPSRPDRMARFGDDVLVTLNHVAPDFAEWGSGRYSRVTWFGDTWGVDREWFVDTASNCGAITGAADGGALVCSGRYVAGEAQPATSAALWLDSTGEPQATLLGNDPRVGGALAPAVAYDGVDILLVRFGSLEGGGDRILRWSPATDAVEEIMEVESSFAVESLGLMANGAFLVPIGVPEAPRLCRWDAEAWSCGDVCTQSGLPPRAILAL
jgi:hypothetical protein